MNTAYKDHEIYNIGRGLYRQSECAVSFNLPGKVVLEEVPVNEKINTLLLLQTKITKLDPEQIFQLLST